MRVQEWPEVGAPIQGQVDAAVRALTNAEPHKAELWREKVAHFEIHAAAVVRNVEHFLSEPGLAALYEKARGDVIEQLGGQHPNLQLLQVAAWC